MPPRRRKGDSRAWWHARASFVLALIFSPPMAVAAVKGVVGVIERLEGAEHDLHALRADVQRIDHELRALRGRSN
jgi:hypothetical protein